MYVIFGLLVLLTDILLKSCNIYSFHRSNGKGSERQSCCGDRDGIEERERRKSKKSGGGRIERKKHIYISLSISIYIYICIHI